MNAGVFHVLVCLAASGAGAFVVHKRHTQRKRSDSAGGTSDDSPSDPAFDHAKAAWMANPTKKATKDPAAAVSAAPVSAPPGRSLRKAQSEGQPAINPRIELARVHRDSWSAEAFAAQKRRMSGSAPSAAQQGGAEGESEGAGDAPLRELARRDSAKRASGGDWSQIVPAANPGKPKPKLVV